MNYLRTIFVALLFCCGCSTLPPLPAADLNEPGWQVRQGQAVWKPRPDAPEIAGDLLLATHPDGREFVQFTKTIPIATAQRSRDGWEVSFGPGGKRYSGRGNPPPRIVWFELADALNDRTISVRWSAQKPEANHLLLSAKGESLEVFLAE
jgi:hypothetical protein